MFQDLSDREDHIVGVAILLHFAVKPSLELQMLRISYSMGRSDDRSNGPEVVE